MITLFIGPTVRSDEIQGAGRLFLPPAAQGDVYKAALAGPRAIGIVDGYFQGKLSIWHKEILWAMSQGIHVFGSSSMGALRAAELHPFGMRGVGRIFEAYRDGVIEDDDEVALLHGPAETGFASLTEPMVNIRATLDAAVEAGVIERTFADRVCGTAKRTFYQKLTWKTLLAEPDVQGSAPDALARLEAWLPTGRIDAKRADAIEMVRVIDEFLATDPAPMAVNYDFEWTHLWDSIVVTYGAGTAGGASADAVWERDLIDELRLDPEAYGRFRRRALLALLALGEGRARYGSVDDREMKEAKKRFRYEHGLMMATDVTAWLAERQMTEADLERELEADLQADRIAAEAGEDLASQILSALRLAPEFAALDARAQRKRDALGKRGEGASGDDETGLTRLKLREWYFETKLQQPIPDDLGVFIAALDLPDENSFYELLARDFAASRLAES